MTRQEFGTLAKAMKAIYADPKFLADQDAFDVWYAMISDLDYATASEALKAYVRSSKGLPGPSDFVKYATNKRLAESMNEQQAWALVTKAIRNSNYYAEEEYGKLPPLVQKAVGSPTNLASWAQLPSDEVHTVISSNFARAYRAEAEREKAEAMLPEELRIDFNRPKEITG